MKNNDSQASSEGNGSVFGDAQRATLTGDLMDSVIEFEKPRNATQDDVRLLPHFANPTVRSDEEGLSSGP